MTYLWRCQCAVMMCWWRCQSDELRKTIVLSQAEVSRVMKYLDDVTADVDDVTAQVKEVGILSYKTNSQEMLAPVRDASRAKLQKLTSQLRTKIRRMNKRTNSKEINFSWRCWIANMYRVLYEVMNVCRSQSRRWNGESGQRRVII